MDKKPYRSMTCAGCGVTFRDKGGYMNHGRGKHATCTREMRFWANVQKGDGCWLWTGTKHFRGYGACTKSYGDTRAHRVAWKLTNGDIPEGLGVLHRCDNMLCVNPAHLFLGDQKANMSDAKEKGRTGNGWKPLDQIIHRQLSRRLKQEGP